MGWTVFLKEKTFNLNKLLQNFGKFWFDLLELITQEWNFEKEQVMCFSNCIKLDKLQPTLHDNVTSPQIASFISFTPNLTPGDHSYRTTMKELWLP